MSDYTKELKGQEKDNYIKEHFKTEKTEEQRDYQKQGTDFLTDTKTKMTVDYIGYDFYFDDDKEKRDIYRITLERNGKKYSFNFGQSINRSNKKDKLEQLRKELKRITNFSMPLWQNKITGELRTTDKQLTNKICLSLFHTSFDYFSKNWTPTAYDILACLTKYDPYTFENFCAEYGYDLDSRKAEKTYHAVKEEFYKVESLFSDVMEQLQEIQ